MPPRCCVPLASEFRPCYASVLVFGADPANLETKVKELESERITSCFTAWCSRCNQTYLLTTDVSAFSTPSAHHTHKLKLLDGLRESGVYFWNPEDAGPTSSDPARNAMPSTAGSISLVPS